MAFSSFEALWHMDGHGVYVWLSYAIWFASLGLLMFTSIRNRQIALRVIRDRWEEQIENEQNP